MLPLELGQDPAITHTKNSRLLKQAPRTQAQDEDVSLQQSMTAPLHMSFTYS